MLQAAARLGKTSLDLKSFLGFRAKESMQESCDGETKKKIIAAEGYHFSHMWGAEDKILEVFSGLLKRQTLRADTLCQLDLWEFFCCAPFAHGNFR